MNSYDLERQTLFTLTPIINDIQKAGSAWTRRREATMSIIKAILDVCTQLSNKIDAERKIVIDTIPCRLILTAAENNLFLVDVESNFNNGHLSFTIQGDKITLDGLLADADALVLRFAQIILTSRGSDFSENPTAAKLYS